MFDEEYEKEILKIPMSDNTVSRRTQNIESQVIPDIKKPIFFATATMQCS
jgi:hypothetical protein